MTDTTNLYDFWYTCSQCGTCNPVKGQKVCDCEGIGFYESREVDEQYDELRKEVDELKRMIDELKEGLNVKKTSEA